MFSFNKSLEQSLGSTSIFCCYFFSQSTMRLTGLYPWAGKRGILLRFQVLFEESKQVLENRRCLTEFGNWPQMTAPGWDFPWQLQLPKAKTKVEISQSGSFLFYFYFHLFLFSFIFSLNN